jgi:hypothetical protein
MSERGVGVNGKFQCPCCLHFTLHERSSYEICPVCFWEDDGWLDEDEESGPNHITMGEGRESYKAIGSCDPLMLKHCRAAFPEESEAK